MSADSRSNCPACLSKELGVPIEELTVSQISQDENTFREWHEFYIDKGEVVADFYGECTECEYSVTLKSREEIPKP